MRNVEVPTGEKTIFGKEKTKIEKKPTKNVIISESDYKKLVTAAKDNEKLKKHVSNFLNTDMAKRYKKISGEHVQVKEKYNDLVERYNSNANHYNELVEENRSLKSKISDLRNEIGTINKSNKEILKESTNGIKAFKSVYNDSVTKVKEKSPKGEFERSNKQEKSKEKDRGMEL